MDDFLHNLRSGKLKQQSGGNRPFNDPQYKGGVRRRPMDQRNKGHHDNKEATERLNAIKEVLESLDRTQKRMAEAYVARTRAEERKAKAMEVLAKNLYKMLNPNAEDVDQLFAEAPAYIPSPVENTMPQEAEPADNARDEQLSEIEEESYNEPAAYFESEEMETEIDHDDDALDENEDDGETDDDVNAKSKGRLTEVDRHTLFAMISQMRDAGEGWEKIARHISAQGYPTISGKGNWRGVMVKTLFEKMEE